MKRWFPQVLGLALVSTTLTARAVDPGPPPPPPPTPAGYEESGSVEEEIRVIGARIESSAVEQFLVETVALGPMRRVALFRSRFLGGSPPAGPSGPSGVPGGDSPESAGGLNFGEHMQHVQISLEGDLGFVNDQELGGEGNDYSMSAFMTAMWDDATVYGFGLTGNRLQMTGDYDIEQYNYTFDMFVSRTVWDNLSIGVFASYTYSELEDAVLTVGTNSVPIGDTSSRFGAGVMANYWKEYMGNTFSLSTSLSNQNNYSLGGFFDSEDLVWVNQLEVSRPLTEQLEAQVYGTTFRSFDNDTSTRDLSHAALGMGLSYQINERTAVSVGYEKSFFYEAYEDNRFSASVTIDW